GDEWIALLNDAGIPCGPINTIDETFADPQVRHLGIATPIEHDTLGEIEVVGQPVHLTRTPQRMRNAAPEHGERPLLKRDGRIVRDLRRETFGETDKTIRHDLEG
ncbi:MAG: CoA transferase, partial [Acidobacteria bacterium]|nr:CoA transferase [Acidobacteriota bacterium]